MRSMRPNAQAGIDAESLQADVMRFMAIIAFCLIAILALVRNVETPPMASASPAAAAPPPAPATQQKDRSGALTAPPAQAKTEPERRVAQLPTPVSPEAAVEPEPEPVRPAPLRTLTTVTGKPFRIAAAQPLEPARPITMMAPIKAPPAPAPVADAPQAQPEKQPERQPKPPAREALASRDPAPAAATAAAVSNDDEPGLSLRFTSDRDFLRLVTRGEVRVFLFKDRTGFELGRDYRFTRARLPTQLYEVMAETIPDPIQRAAAAMASAPQSMRWGLAMPARIERRIAEYVARVDQGELRIDRFGEVHHVAP
ncbi:MAG: hypothetical protein AAGI15_13930 [Pseudomonadota bacterium]